MAGPMGSGKSTLAGRIGAATGAVVLDLDVVKSAALEAGAEWDTAGRVAYRALHALAASILGQGLSVVLDSPCRHAFIVEGGTAAATAHGAVYCYLECALGDPDEHRRRLRARPRLRSQGLDWDTPPPDAPPRAYDDPAGTLWNSHRPDTPWRTIDTAAPPERCLEEALAHLADRLTS
jgi:predicted kinase